MIKKVSFTLFFLLSTYTFPSLKPENIHTVYMIAQIGFEDKAKQILNLSFDYEDYNTQFLSDQFVKWSVNKSENSEMQDAFNESAYYVVINDRKSAIKAIKNKIENADLQTDEFAESFVDWGLSLLQLSKILKQLESDN